MFQSVLVLALFLISAAFLVRKARRTLDPESHDCEGCAVSKLSKGDPASSNNH